MDGDPTVCGRCSGPRIPGTNGDGIALLMCIGCGAQEVILPKRATPELTGQTMYSEELRKDIDFWRECGAESGRGYKQRIVVRNEGWFSAEPRGALESQFRDVLQREWNTVLAGVGALFEADGDQ